MADTEKTDKTTYNPPGNREERFRSLFVECPVSLWEEDITDLTVHLDNLRSQGIEDMRAYLECHPEEVARCAGLIRITAVNKATLELYQARDEGHFLAGLSAVFTDESFVAFREILVALTEGRTVFDVEAVNRTLQGKRLQVSLKWSLLPDSRGKLNRALVSVTDITDRKRAEDEHLSHLRFLEGLERIDRVIHQVDSLERMLTDVLDTALSLFESDRAWLIYPCDPEATSWRVPMERTRAGYPGALAIGIDLPTTPEVRQFFLEVLNSSDPVIHDPQSGRSLPEVTRQFSVQSQIMSAIYPKIGKPWVFGMHQCSHARVWSENDVRLFTEIARRIADSLSSLLFLRDLRESDRDLKEAQDIARLGRWELNLVNNSLQWSDTIFKLFEIDKTQFDATYDAFLQAIHPDDRKMVNKVYTDSLKQKQPYAIMHRLLMKDGRVKWVIEMCRTDYNSQGQAVRSVGIVQDITELKQAEETAWKSRETLEKIFRSLDSALFILDNSNPPVVTECNPAATRIFGYEKEDMLGHTTEFLHVNKESLSEFQAENYAAIKKRGFLSSFEFLMKKRNGVIFPTEHSVFPLLDDFGTRIGWVSLVKDITKRRRAEQQTRDALSFIRTMMESSPIGIVSIKATGAVVAANEAMTRISGGTVEQLLKQNVRHLEAWKKYGLLSTLDEALATNSEKRIETDYISTFGKHVWISVRFVPYTFEGEPHVLALFWDMSDRKRDEMEREKLQSQLLQAQKMEAVGQLAGGIAHDFNNILTAIIGYGHLARLKLRDDDPVRTYLNEIVLSADRAAALTHSLLAFGRKQTINPQHFDLNSVINKIQKLLIRIIGEDIELKTVLSDKPLIIFADASQMEQVLMNLATNARDAMPEGGKFFVETQRIDVDNEYVRNHGYGEIGPYAMLTLTDTGGGIEPDIKDRIFEPFFTTKEMGKGTGLGLSIVYGIVKQHNGHITVYSEIGKGTSFKILFPLSEVQDSGSQLSESSATQQRGTETVLLAEDDAAVRALNKSILEDFGYHVIEAVNGLDALEKFAENKDTVQLLILDVIMPGKNGKEVYDAVKAMDPRIKALFTSGYPADLIQKKGVLEEGLHFITKPAEPRAFLAKIRTVLES